MPEFILNDTISAPRPVNAAAPFPPAPFPPAPFPPAPFPPAPSDFVAGYIEAMFFTNGDTGDSEEDLLNRLGTGRLTRKAREVIERDCAQFLAHVLPGPGGATVGDLLARLDRSGRYGLDYAGHDFWLTRQGHGAGYWDRGLGKVGDILTDAAEAQGESYVETWRGWIHVR